MTEKRLQGSKLFLSSLGWKIFFLICTMKFLTACSGVPIRQDSRKGLFQLDSMDYVRRTKARGRPKEFSDKGQVLKVPGTFYISNRGFIWPLKNGRLSSYFGPRNRDFHEGLDIKANSGDPVYAAASGRVLFSGRAKKGYGNLVILQHDSGLVSVYAHNQRNIARQGEKIRQGQLLARVGATGRATGPHLHFEVRVGEKPMDPLYYLTDPVSPNRSVAGYRKRNSYVR